MTQALIDSKIAIFQQNPHSIITVLVLQNSHFVVPLVISYAHFYFYVM